MKRSKEERKAEKQKAKKDKKDDKKRRKSSQRSSMDPSEDYGKRRTFSNVYDIDPKDPDANRAATRIQATYRGHTTRRSLKNGRPGTGGDNKDFDPSSQGASAWRAGYHRDQSGRLRPNSRGTAQCVSSDMQWSNAALSDLEKVVMAAFGAAVLSMFYYGWGDN